MTRLHRTVLVLLAVLLAVLLVGCGEDRVPARSSFYFWRTRLELSPVEQKALSELGVKRLRVRLFDVVRDGKDVHPVGKLRAAPGASVPVNAVLPVVFLREAVFRDGALPDSLALRLLAERDRICQESRLPCKGLELDCDWTPGSREGFFALCRVLRDSLHRRDQRLHATLRLHQFRSPGSTGIPPVDRLTLMVYNMGPTTASPERQSILDLKELGRWLEGIRPYPIPLDVALPIWSWALILRNGHPVDLLQRIDRLELDSLAEISPAGKGLWKARCSFFLHGLWIRENDVLKLEAPSQSGLESAAKLLSKALPPDTAREVIFFDLSPSSLEEHPVAELKTLAKLL